MERGMDVQGAVKLIRGHGWGWSERVEEWCNVGMILCPQMSGMVDLLSINVYQVKL